MKFLRQFYCAGTVGVVTVVNLRGLSVYIETDD